MIAGVGLYKTHVADVRFKNNPRNFPGISREGGINSGGVVVG